MGSTKGENYCGSIYRVLIKYNSNKNLALIIKCIGINEDNDFLEILNVFEKEKMMYMDVIPKIQNLVNCSYLAGKCFEATSEPMKTFVFEDLCAKGFQMAVRQKGLDENHCRLILTKLAKFHAGSMVFAKQNPDVMKNFTTGLFNEKIIDHPTFKVFFADNLKYLANEVSNWNGYEIIANKLHKIHENLRERCLNVTKPRHGEIKVLNHGDLWVNNFMFKYDENDKNYPTDCVFVDFQMSYHGSPGIDLNYILNTSLQLDVLKNKCDQLLHCYHQVLEKTLNELNYSEIPTYDDIKNEYKNKEFYGLITGAALLPLMSMDKSTSNDNSIETFLNENVAEMKRKLMFSSKRCQEQFKFTLKRYNEMGILD